MSTWITASGPIGQYTQGQPMSFTFQASPTLGGVITYVLTAGSVLPVGLTLNQTTGVLSGTPTYVPVDTETAFSVSATETTSGGSFTNPRSFTITVSTLVWNTTAGNIGIFAENVPLAYQFSATPSQPGNTLRYLLLNGNFPSGKTQPFTLSPGGLLTGTPAETSRAETSQFTIRAYELNGSLLTGFRDRTFDITVDLGVTAPQFTTPSGALFTVNDSTWTSFQVEYNNPDPGTTAVVTLVIGSLPTGLEINSSGLIRGYASPPYDSDGNPTTLTSEFTLQIKSESGTGLSSYSITIVNQELLLGFTGRSPTLLNTRPFSYLISPSDPYEAYYFSGTSIGEYAQNSEFIFKFIGYDFDGIDDLIYEVNGLESVGIQNNQTTGWQNGILPNIGDNITSYNFTVRVYKLSNPSLTSDTFLFNFTVTGNIVTAIEWITDPDLSTINNGQISDLSILAIADERITLRYRIIGTEISSNLKTIVGTGTQLLSFGDLGSYVIGSADGQSWENQPPIAESVTSVYFTDAAYDQFTENCVLVGYNQINSPIIGQLTSENQFFPSSVLTSNSLNSVIKSPDLFIAVGDNGTITTTVNPSSWVDIQNSGTTNNLNSICYSTIPGYKYTVVGDLGTILTSPDGYTWTSVNSTTTINLRSVVCSGSTLITVGDLGTILISPDSVNWSESQNTSFDFSLKSVAVDSDQTKLLAVGDGGSILQSTDQGISWQLVVNTISTTDLFGIFYDGVITNSFYIVGSGGTVLIYNNDPLSSEYETLTSPTIVTLPPDLTLLPTGEISGRLAFESTDQIVDQNVTRTYQFTVQAYSTEFSQINDTRLFTLTTNQQFYLPYDNIYIQALTGLGDRAKINELLGSDDIIPPEYIYRSDDPYFGKAKNIRYQHIFGVPSVAVDDFYQRYIEAVQINHYWRNITLGEIRTAVATDSAGTPLYEVVYSAVQDNLVNSQGVSISKQIVWPRNIPLNLNDWYTSRTNVSDSDTWYDQSPIVKRVVIASGNTVTLDNVEQLTVGMNVTVPAGKTITSNTDGTPPVIQSIDSATNQIVLSAPQSLVSQSQLLFNDPVYTSLTPGEARVLYPNSLPDMRQQIYDSIGRVDATNLLPLWMTSLQPDGTILGYTPAWVICYCRPGTAELIRQRILAEWPYTLNQIDFQLDRFEVDRSKTYNYLGTTAGGVPSWSTLPSAQPNVVGNDQDSYVYFPRKTILPNATQ